MCNKLEQTYRHIKILKIAYLCYYTVHTPNAFNKIHLLANIAY